MPTKLEAKYIGVFPRINTEPYSLYVPWDSDGSKFSTVATGTATLVSGEFLKAKDCIHIKFSLARVSGYNVVLARVPYHHRHRCIAHIPIDPQRLRNYVEKFNDRGFDRQVKVDLMEDIRSRILKNMLLHRCRDL